MAVNCVEAARAQELPKSPLETEITPAQQVNFAASVADFLIEFGRATGDGTEVELELPAVDVAKDFHGAHFRAPAPHAAVNMEDLDRSDEPAVPNSRRLRTGQPDGRLVCRGGRESRCRLIVVNRHVVGILS